MMRPVVLMLAAAAALALDLEIDSYSCDETLPVTADIFMACTDDNSARCTFGEEITVYGDLHYNSVADSGTNGETLYVSAELSLFSIDFSLVNKVSVPLCYDGEEEAADEEAANDGGRRLEEYECPNDGSYAFSVQYVLPTAGKETTSWLASGWTGTGVVQMYAQANDQMLIGECILTLSTYVTREDTASLLSTPSAAATTGIILAVVLASILMCFYCYCCVKSRKSRKESLEEGDDVTSNFRRMDEDGASKPSAIHIDAASQAKSKASAAEMI